MEVQPSQAGTSLHGEIHSSGFPLPPITPYDILFLVTTIVVGIAKAVTASRGATIAPTTLEWVGSVIIFLLFYVIGWYKFHEPKAKWLERFFNTKSQRFPHNLRKPTLDGTNEPLDSETKNTPIVTGNRIFVTISVVCFGMSKAIVTYRGLPTPANTLDWLIAIVFSSLTYCLEMYQDEAAYAWPSAFQTDYQPSLYSGTTFLGMTLMFSIGLLITSLWTIIMGYSLVLLWNWVPEKPPTKPLLPPSLDYIHLISCKILWSCYVIMALAVSPFIMPTFGIEITLRIIRRSVLNCIAHTSRFLNAISPAIIASSSMQNLLRPLGQAASWALVRVGLIHLFHTAAEFLSETMFVQRLFRLFKRISFWSGFGLLLSFVLAIVSPIASVGLWIPTTALHDHTNLPHILRLFYTFGCIVTSIVSGAGFVTILYSTEQLNTL